MITLFRPISLSALTILAFTLPAAAQQAGYAEVSCSSSSRQGALTSCDGYRAITMQSGGPGTIYGLRVTAPATHCSPVFYSVSRFPHATGNDIAGMSGILRAGESTWFELGRDFAAGTHELRISAVGAVEGCNTGQMSSWGVNWEFLIIPE